LLLELQLQQVKFSRALITSQLLLEFLQLLLEEGARRVGNYVGGGVVGGIGPVRSIAGATGDILAGNVFKGTPYETPARVVGGILGASVPSGAASLISPPALSPERAAAVRPLKVQGYR
jgi:hypothetical protein